MQCNAQDTEFRYTLQGEDMRLTRILVPYDGSKPSENALMQAIEIAKSFGSSDLILLHVIAEFPSYHLIDRPARSIKTGEKTSLSQYMKEVYELLQENAAEVLSRKKEQIKKSSDFEITTKIMRGHVSDTIIEYAKKENAELIVIGNTGRSGISRLRTLGSVSRSVSERAPCPVMIVH
jgi:nucleotide-binding universal stress UspA family protein